ncbi:MAG TPA: dihydrolipoamide acetyltransferase family protein [Rhizomicrobium sp.]|nr:dihydrolipoamide acetyltransferase family protein [Rhizomicrobium sp.]
MGQYLFRLPDIGEGIAEAEITAWHVKPGDRVREDQPLLDVMTDKATVDMSSPVEGTIVAVHGAVGSKASVGSVLVEMDVAGEGAAPARPLAAPNGHADEAKAASLPRAAPPGGLVNPDPSASPATRRRAMEWGIELKDVRGTGRNGIITVEDLERYRSGAQARATVPAQAGIQPDLAAPPEKLAHHRVEEIPVVGLRRRIAERMLESKRSIPHFSYVEEFDLTELEGLRTHLNANRREDQPKLTLLPFFMRAVVKLVPDFPNVNAHYDEEQGLLKRFAAVHVGIATQTPQGLMVPVVRHAETRDVWGCAAELARVTGLARDGSASRDQLSGSTITLSSLGPLGGIAATPIINPPEVAILGPNKLVERPVLEGAYLTRRKLLNLSSSFDHRIVDGHEAASFIQRLKQLMEHPALIFME